MINKLYEKSKKIIKENYKEIIFLISFLIIVNFPLDYTIMVSGGTINIDDRIKIEEKYKSKGSFNLAYVTELKGTIPTVLLSYVIPSWTKVDLEEYKAASKETMDDIEKRSKIYLEYSKQAAIKVAYDNAGKSFHVNDYKFYVVYIDDSSEGDLKIGDIILKVNDNKLTDLSEYKQIIQEHNIGDEIKLTVKRSNEEKTVNIKVKNIDGEKLTGISILPLYDYEVSPNIELTFKDNESGSSGGLMLTLAIYDKLMDEDLTKGLKIVGTGTIDFEGNIGQIDGVEYKLKGAVKDKADVFIVPYGDNYDDCIKLKKEKGYDIKIIGASTFKEAFEKLTNSN